MDHELVPAKLGWREEAPPGVVREPEHRSLVRHGAPADGGHELAEGVRRHGVCALPVADIAVEYAPECALYRLLLTVASILCQPWR